MCLYASLVILINFSLWRFWWEKAIWPLASPGVFLHSWYFALQFFSSSFPEFVIHTLPLWWGCVLNSIPFWYCCQTHHISLQQHEKNQLVCCPVGVWDIYCVVTPSIIQVTPCPIISCEAQQNKHANKTTTTQNQNDIQTIPRCIPWSLALSFRQLFSAWCSRVTSLLHLSFSFTPSLSPLPLMFPSVSPRCFCCTH